MKILDERQIKQKTVRLAYEILENHYDEPELILAGINRNGMVFAERLRDQLEAIGKVPIRLIRVKLNPAAPLSEPVQIEIDPEELRGKSIIVVDDVANTGRTIFYAFKPMMDVVPKVLEAAVLVDRKHKAFPIRVDYVGLSLATTLMEDIDVRIREEEGEQAVYLN